MTLREKLLRHGIETTQIHATVMRNIYSLPHRLWWRLRLGLGADPFTAELTFIE